MKLSEMIKKLQEALEKNGDAKVDSIIIDEYNYKTIREDTSMNVCYYDIDNSYSIEFI